MVIETTWLYQIHELGDVAGGDAWIRKYYPTYNYGYCDSMVVRQRDTSNDNRALIKFAVGLEDPPYENLTITHIELGLHFSAVYGEGAFEIFQLATEFTEGTGSCSGSATGNGATWETIDGFTEWAEGGRFGASDQEGGDFTKLIAQWYIYTSYQGGRHWLDIKYGLHQIDADDWGSQTDLIITGRGSTYVSIVSSNGNYYNRPWVRIWYDETPPDAPDGEIKVTPNEIDPSKIDIEFPLLEGNNVGLNTEGVCYTVTYQIDGDVERVARVITNNKENKITYTPLLTEYGKNMAFAVHYGTLQRYSKGAEHSQVINAGTYGWTTKVSSGRYYLPSINYPHLDDYSIAVGQKVTMDISENGTQTPPDGQYVNGVQVDWGGDGLENGWIDYDEDRRTLGFDESYVYYEQKSLFTPTARVRTNLGFASMTRGTGTQPFVDDVDPLASMTVTPSTAYRDEKIRANAELSVAGSSEQELFFRFNIRRNQYNTKDNWNGSGWQSSSSNIDQDNPVEEIDADFEWTGWNVQVSRYISETSTTLYLNDATEFSSGGGYVLIGSEIIKYSGKSGNYLTLASVDDRGYYGTLPTAHSVGEPVYVYEYTLQSRVIAFNTDLSGKSGAFPSASTYLETTVRTNRPLIYRDLFPNPVSISVVNFNKSLIIDTLSSIGGTADKRINIGRRSPQLDIEGSFYVGDVIADFLRLNEIVDNDLIVRIFVNEDNTVYIDGRIDEVRQVIRENNLLAWSGRVFVENVGEL